MIKPFYQNGNITIYFGDCRDIIPELSNITSVITDPPYELGFMGKEWDKQGVSFDPHTWKLVAAACKPGAPLLAFGGTRTQHRMVCAIEDAGWDIRDTLMWLYGSGFPKSLDISKAIDKVAGAKREVVGKSQRHNSRPFGSGEGDADYGTFVGGVPDITAPSSDAAKEWQGYGTALKPAWEPICLAMKPLVEPALDILQAVVVQLRHNGLEGEIRWIQEPATSVERQNPNQISISTTQPKTVAPSAKPVGDTVLLSTERNTEKSLSNDPETGGQNTKPAASNKAKRAARNAETKCLMPMGESVPAAEKQPMGSLPLTTSMEMGNNIASKSDMPIPIEISSNEDSPTPTDSSATTVIVLSEDMANVRTKYSVRIENKQWEIKQLNDGSLVWPHDLPQYRPARQSTFAHNALTHGVAGLNIDGCRIGYSSESDKASATPQGECTAKVGALAGGTQTDTERSKFQRPEQKGRWPANLLLSHTPECKCVGTKKVKNRSGSVSGNELSTPGLNTYGEYDRKGFDAHKDSEGNETVESWECTPECPVRMLDEQSGDCSSHWLGNAKGVGAKGGKMFGGNEQIRPVPKQEYLDIGGASRFFYCAKADRAERDAGCEEMSEVSVSYMNTHGGDAEKGETWHPIDDRTGQKRDRFSTKARNDHPTVKPLSLMIYLTKLVSPPKDALILDPFMGSGTTGVACQKLGIPFIGIDNNERNCEIASKRMGKAYLL